MEYARKQDDFQWGPGKKSKRALKAVLLLSGDDSMVQAALIVPLMFNIAMAYPGANEWLIDQVMSITATTMILTMIFSSRIARHFDKKYVIMLGTALFTIAGVSGMFVVQYSSSIITLIISRAILGVGAGLAFPLIPSSIVFLFKQRQGDQMLGWMNAVGALLSFTLGIAAGYVALIDWSYAFLFYLLFIPVLILQGFFLPHFKPEKLEYADAYDAAHDKSRKAEREHVTWQMWAIGIAMVCFMVVCMVATFKISAFVEGQELGTSANSGLGNSCMTGGSFLISLFFAQYLAVFKKFSPALSLCFAAVSFMLIAGASNIYMVYASMILLGFGMGSMNPFLFSAMSHAAPDSKKTLGMSMMTIFQLCGQVFAPYYMMLITLLGFTGERQLFAVTGAILIVAAIAVFVVCLVRSLALRKEAME